MKVQKFRRIVVLAGLAVGFATQSQTAAAQETMLYPFDEDNIQLVAADYLERLQFRDYTRDTFWLSKNTEDAPIKLELRRVIKLSKHAYMLKYRTRDMQVLPQKTFKIDHDTLGPMALFVTSATNRRETRRFYNAIINKESE